MLRALGRLGVGILFTIAVLWALAAAGLGNTTEVRKDIVTEAKERCAARGGQYFYSHEAGHGCWHPSGRHGF